MTILKKVGTLVIFLFSLAGAIVLAVMGHWAMATMPLAVSAGVFYAFVWRDFFAKKS